MLTDDPRKLRIADYTYPLPDARIARYPLAERDASKLLIYQDGTIEEDIYRHIHHHISPETLMVFNQTKVVHARLLFHKATGSSIEVFCLGPHGQYADLQTAMAQKGNVLWECLVGGAAKWKPGMVLQLVNEAPQFTLSASIAERGATSYTLRLEWSDQLLTFAEVLHFLGKVPLPPYLQRDADEGDEKQYQTVFAKEEGSVAAPTAGLHFTSELMEQLAEKNIATTFLTLHVGAGTFRPVKSDTMNEHEMHAEWIEVTRATVEQLIASMHQKIVAVGTTSLRTLESLYWLGNKMVNGKVPDLHGVAVSQWDPYEEELCCAAEDALEALVRYMEVNHLSKLITRTQILIAPGYSFKLVKGLVTNFHQPCSTLLLLVAALIGDDWRRVYDYALQHDFRFLSYGDGSLLWSGASEI